MTPAQRESFDVWLRLAGGPSATLESAWRDGFEIGQASRLPAGWSLIESETLEPTLRCENGTEVWLENGVVHSRGLEGAVVFAPLHAIDYLRSLR